MLGKDVKMIVFALSASFLASTHSLSANTGSKAALPNATVWSTSVCQAECYAFYVVSATPGDTFGFLAEITGMKFEVDTFGNREIRDQEYRGSIEAIVTDVAIDAGLDWFFFNGVYYVSDQAMSSSRLLRLDEISYDTAEGALVSAGIKTSALEQKEVANGSAIVLTGPPKLLAFGEAIIESLPNDMVAKNARQIRVRRGAEVTVEVISSETELAK